MTEETGHLGMVANLTSVTETEVCVPAREPPLVRPWTSHAPFLTREMRSQTPTSWRGSGTGDQPSQVCLGQRDFLGHKTFRAQTGTPQRTEVSRSPPTCLAQHGLSLFDNSRRPGAGSFSGNCRGFPNGWLTTALAQTWRKIQPAFEEKKKRCRR